MTTKLTTSDRARTVHREHPDWTPADIAAEVRRQTRRPCSRQLVAEALKNTGKHGVPHNTFRLFVAAPLALEPYLDTFMRDGGYQSRSEAVLAFLESGLVPRRERKTYEAERGSAP